MSRQIVTVPGGRLEVFASEPAPITLATTHPFQYFGRDGGPLFGPLSNAGRVVVVNPRGTGASSEAIDLAASITELVEDLDAIRRVLGLSTWVVVGQSLGGCVALEYALRHPGSTAALVLSCTTAEGIADEPLSIYHPDHPDNPTIRAELAAGRSAAARQLVAHRAHLVADEPSGGVSPDRQRSFVAQLPTLALGSRLGELAAPTLVIGGRHDRAIPVRHAEELADGIVDARLVIFEHSGHFPYLEEPGRFSLILREFLAPLDG
ncbi:MAG: alpha/beta hydrolase [Acidimicrobiales bacterium]